MKKVLNIYKPISATPYQMVEKLKVARPEYAESTISYAGRLDPMAEGVLVLLVDEENKNREKYQGLDKEYAFEVLLGIETDTYDLLGIVKMSSRHSGASPKGVAIESPDLAGNGNRPKEDFSTPNPTRFGAITLRQAQGSRVTSIEKKASEYIKNLVGRRVQKYPPYSSYTIDGKPLFQWAKEGRIGEVELPEKEIVIYESEYLGRRTISPEDLYQTIIERVSKVEGKFRQKEILKRWEIFFETTKEKELADSLKLSFKDWPAPPKRLGEGGSQSLAFSSASSFPILKFRIACSSGTYIRQIAHKVGEITKTGALAFHIKRTRVGKYTIDNSTRPKK